MTRLVHSNPFKMLSKGEREMPEQRLVSNLKMIFLTSFFLISLGLNAQTGIGTSNPNAAAKLDVSSTTSGFLPPRMSAGQRNAIASPPAGLIVWCNNCGTYGELQVYNGTAWTNVTGGTASFATPGAPTIGTVTAGNAQASVPFTQPASNGGSTITSYTATSSPGGFTGTLTQAGSGTITVTGLSNGTAYTFTVIATNSVGTSATSAASNSVTPAPPVLRTLSFEFNNDLPQIFYGTTWSADWAWNSIRGYGGTVHTGTYSWMVNFSSYQPTVQLSNSANFNAKSIWVMNNEGNSISSITIKGYNSSNVLVGTVTAGVSWDYGQVTINMNAVRYLVISTNGTDPMGMGEGLIFDDLSFEQ